MAALKAAICHIWGTPQPSGNKKQRFSLEKQIFSIDEIQHNIDCGTRYGSLAGIL